MVNRNKYCQDPIGKHKRKVYSNLRTVTESLSALVKGKIKVNILLCSNCCNDIRKNPNSYMSNICDEISDIKSTSSTHASSTDFDLPEASTVNVENILALSGVSPIKKSKKLGFIIY